MGHDSTATEVVIIEFVSKQGRGLSSLCRVGPARRYDIPGAASVGTLHTTGSKIAEHGGDNPGDRDVPLVVYAPSASPVK